MDQDNGQQQRSPGNRTPLGTEPNEMHWLETNPLTMRHFPLPLMASVLLCLQFDEFTL